jgi:hypothetical protein
MAVAANNSAWDEPSVAAGDEATEAATSVGEEDSLTSCMYIINWGIYLCDCRWLIVVKNEWLILKLFDLNRFLLLLLLFFLSD